MRERFAFTVYLAAAVRPKITAGDPKERSFPRAVRAENRPMLARSNRPVDGIENFLAAGQMRDATKFERWSFLHSKIESFTCRFPMSSCRIDPFRGLPDDLLSPAAHDVNENYGCLSD